MPPHTPRSAFLPAVLLLLLAVPALAAGTVPDGRITVLSTPSGAHACVDNKVCDTTPATFSVEGNAWHLVVVTEKGYRDWTDTLFVTADQTSQEDAYLDLDPNATGIRVSVSPVGGTVCLDNIVCRENAGPVGGTETFFAGVAPGYHTISVESPAGYGNTQQLIRVELGQIAELGIVLQPVTATPTPTSAGTGAIRVYVDRTGSTVCLDNTQCAQRLGGTPGPGTVSTVFSDVPAGEMHIVTVAADGFRPFSQRVLVEKDRIATLDVALLPLDRVTTAPATPAPTVSPPAPTAPPVSPTLPPVPIATKSPTGPGTVIGALGLCGLAILCRRNRQ